MTHARWSLGAAALVALATAATGGAPAPAAAQEALVKTYAKVFMYHRFGEGRYPSTNIRLEQLKSQLNFLQKNGYQFISVTRLANALQNGEKLPEKSVVITVDDAYSSFYETGWPVFKKRDIPVALFTSTKPVDAGRGGYMTWDQLREVQKQGVYIGHHSHAHAHMTRAFDLQGAKADLDKASRLFEKELGQVPKIFAYPYGEYSLALKKEVAKRFDIAFGQHSGVPHNEADLAALPRYALNENYGSMDDFELRAKTLPLPVSEVIPQETVVTAKNNPPRVGFTIDEGVANPKSVNCFASGQGKAPAEFLGERRMEVRIDQAFEPPRARVNCTLHAGGGQFRWYGRQFTIHAEN